ncbi:ATP-grasp domain-containing protein [Streptomyces hiroshimensis]|uniref:ATP-grasp domain-containing protein n=1 Tax=Streptomyces hiroshimensis TaxID=66424 RepID=A0ABQ2Y457_9ACTN|nr:ATP-grasp domain-containing protein [Streptomyces hiroshimensis]GGX60649.1 ATP-grasp domain-containing protein [Streptomyces hiroshimensis]
MGTQQDVRRQRNVILVDSYETAEHGVPQTARHIAPAFIRAGYSCVRVQSSAQPPGVYASSRPALENYVANLVHDGDLARTVAELRAYDPVAVVPGGEYGVAFADVLSEALGLPTNGTALSRARRDKAEMAEAVRRAGLRAAEQLRAESEQELVDWHRKLGGRIVVKPLSSAGGDGVAFCDTPEQSAAAFRRIVGADDIFSRPNTAVLAQEYLVGTEYIVNTASLDGLHHAAEIWRSSRFSVNGIRDLSGACYIVPRRGEVQDQLVEYAFGVLDALGVRHGPAHVELKMTPDGPCLIEAGARLSGGDLPHYARLAAGESQLDWAVDAYVRPKRFLARRGEPYEIDRYFAWVALISPAAGRLKQYRNIEEIRSLESFREMWELVRPGEEIVPTVDDTTYPVIINLMHEVEEVVQRDMGTIRYLDGAGFYELEG